MTQTITQAAIKDAKATIKVMEAAETEAGTRKRGMAMTVGPKLGIPSL